MKLNTKTNAIPTNVRVLDRDAMRRVVGGLIIPGNCRQSCLKEFRACQRVGALGCEDELSLCISACQV